MRKVVSVCLMTCAGAGLLCPESVEARRLSEILSSRGRGRSSESTLPAAAPVASLGSPSQPLPAAPAPVVTPRGADIPEDPNRALEEHGVSGGNRGLIAFLEKGLSKERYARMPSRPVEKCQLVIDAMARLAQARSRDAVPVLTRIASLRLPDGVTALLQHDLAQTAPGSRSDFQTKAMRLLQFNAVNALGLIADPSAADVVRAVYAQETNAAARIQHALNLACLGDASGVDFLVEQIERLNRRESAAAARVFMMITGQDFEYTENTALRARRSKARQYREWWRQNRGQFALASADVLARRIQPRQQLPYQPRNTRDLLKVAAQYFDFSNTLGTRQARETLKGSGRSLNGELERIATDPMEDLDVRLEAMNWFYENNRSGNRSGVRSLMQKLRRDENPEVGDKAQTLIEQIEDDNLPGGTMALSQ